MKSKLKQHWFFIGLILIFVLTILDFPKDFVTLGQFLKNNHGPDCVIIFIFLFSGLTLDFRKISAGLKDVKSLFAALGLIFIAAPMAAVCFSILPIGVDILTGLFIVSAMPTTLSSGVVMTGKAGGNIANALLITIIAGIIAVFTVPVTIELLLQFTGDTAVVTINKSNMIFKIAVFVLCPLLAGMSIRFFARRFFERNEKKFMLSNQIFVLAMIWMAVSQAKVVIIENSGNLLLIVILVFLFHSILLAAAFLLSNVLKLKSGKKESVVFMGGQKTLPLAVIIQITFFSQYPVALVVCVLHHAVHLVMDSYIAGRIEMAKR